MLSGQHVMLESSITLKEVVLLGELALRDLKNTGSLNGFKNFSLSLVFCSFTALHQDVAF